MPNDPGLAGDTCIFVEAIAGDGGAHHANEAWWLSPDVALTGPEAGPDNADGGQANPATVSLIQSSTADVIEGGLTLAMVRL